MRLINIVFSFFFFNDPATTEIYTLSLHDALPILATVITLVVTADLGRGRGKLYDPEVSDGHILVGVENPPDGKVEDRKSTRLNSSHSQISYAVFCLKKKKRYKIRLKKRVLS